MEIDTSGDGATAVGDAPDEEPRRRFGREVLPARVRIGILVVAVLAGAGVLGARWLDQRDRPQAGDRHDVTITVDRQCGEAGFEVDGLIGRTQAVPEPLFWDWPADTDTGTGTVELTSVHDLASGDGVSFDGTLTLDDGRTVAVQGGTEGKTFFTLACAIRAEG